MIDYHRPGFEKEYPNGQFVIVNIVTTYRVPPLTVTCQIQVDCSR